MSKMLSWCDALGSVPTVGLRLDPHYLSTEGLISCFSGLLDQFSENKKQQFSLEQGNDLQLIFTTFNGFQYAIDSTKISVAAVHRYKLKTGEGGRLVPELASSPLPFSELLDEVSRRLVSAAHFLPRGQMRKFDRVGIIATTNMLFDDAPPGILAFVEYLSKPWKAEPSPDMNVRIMGDLGARKGSRDRCFHQLARSEDNEDDVLTAAFDWQRTFDDPKSLSRTNVEGVVKEARLDAIAYFESLGEGGRFGD